MVLPSMVVYRDLLLTRKLTPIARIAGSAWNWLVRYRSVTRRVADYLRLFEILSTDLCVCFSFFLTNALTLLLLKHALYMLILAIFP